MLQHLIGVDFLKALVLERQRPKVEVPQHIGLMFGIHVEGYQRFMPVLAGIAADDLVPPASGTDQEGCHGHILTVDASASPMPKMCARRIASLSSATPLASGLTGPSGKT